MLKDLSSQIVCQAHHMICSNATTTHFTYIAIHCRYLSSIYDERQNIVCCLAWGSYETTKSGSRGCLRFFCLLLAPFLSYQVTLSNLNIKLCAIFYNMVCHIWLISVGGMPAFEEKGGGGLGKRKFRGNGMKGGRGKYGLDLMYEKRRNKERQNIETTIIFHEAQSYLKG